MLVAHPNRHWTKRKSGSEVSTLPLRDVVRLRTQARFLFDQMIKSERVPEKPELPEPVYEGAVNSRATGHLSRLVAVTAPSLEKID
jgi:hypothetical protein